MPNKKLLIGGGIAIAIALAAYIVTTPKEVKNAPVSSEEFNQEMQGLDFSALTGSDREKAISHLRDMAEGLASGRGPMGGRGPRGDRGPRDGRERTGSGSSEQRPERRNPMESLEPDERRQIMEPAFRRFREEEEKRMEDFFKKTPEEQDAELDQIVERMERWDDMRAQWQAGRGNRPGGGRPQGATSGNASSATQRQTTAGRNEGGASGSSNRGGRWGRRRTPDESKRRTLARLQRGTSESRAKRQEFMRRIAARRGQRRQAAQKGGAAAAAAKRQAEQRAREAERQQRKPVEEEIIVEEAVKDGLQKLKIGDPLTIANVAKPDEVEQIVVARAGQRVGELPSAKQTEYAEYLSKRRHIWVKVLEVSPASNYLKIEVKVD